jgi:glycosyltransferase involved in cell wall biosynthesis
MRIGLVAPVWFPVPPKGYGGVERVVSLLADGLTDAGHDVVLFASGESRTKAELDAVFPEAPTEWIGQTYWEIQHALRSIARSGELDVLNDHTGMLGLVLGGLVDVPFVHTVHGPLDGRPGEIYGEICRLVPRVGLISISRSQRQGRNDLPWVANCHNALDLTHYPFSADERAVKRDEYVLFLGRMSPEKGAHHAVRVAQEAGIPLKIAAKCREPKERQYFEQFVGPHLNSSIEYEGEVGGNTKLELLQRARALLVPISREEPFGLVMVEAMACGTPVVATRRGSVPEVVEHGRGGIVVDDPCEMAAALDDADQLDPSEIRAIVEDQFAPDRMVRSYLEAYESVIEQAGAATLTTTTLATLRARTGNAATHAAAGLRKRRVRPATS